jgi:hypothetical protein
LAAPEKIRGDRGLIPTGGATYEGEDAVHRLLTDWGMNASPVEFVPRAHGRRENNSALTRVADLMRAEYLEMPCLSLTLRQAIRLWDLDKDLCVRALDTLVRAGFLELSRDGRYRVAHHETR